MERLDLQKRPFQRESILGLEFQSAGIDREIALLFSDYMAQLGRRLPGMERHLGAHLIAILCDPGACAEEVWTQAYGKHQDGHYAPSQRFVTHHRFISVNSISAQLTRWRSRALLNHFRCSCSCWRLASVGSFNAARWARWATSTGYVVSIEISTALWFLEKVSMTAKTVTAYASTSSLTRSWRADAARYHWLIPSALRDVPQMLVRSTQ